MPNGSTAPASDICKLEHKLRDPARIVDIVPVLVHTSLLSASKLASTVYIKIYDRKEVNVYDSSTTKIILSEESLLKGWWCQQSTLWRIPLTPQVKNLNMDTLLLYIPNGKHYLNSLYEILRTVAMLNNFSIFMQDRPTPK